MMKVLLGLMNGLEPYEKLWSMPVEKYTRWRADHPLSDLTVTAEIVLNAQRSLLFVEYRYVFQAI